MQNNRKDALDVMRGLAIISVVVFHATMTLGHHWAPVQWLLRVTTVGWLGVDIFFTLSGFLFTGILLKYKSENLKLREYLTIFYSRGALRIFPLYFGVLIILLIVPQFIATLKDADYFCFLDMQPWFWFHSANLAREVLGATKPVLEFGRIELTHFWTLAVEEHFYLFWSFIIFFCEKRVVLYIATVIVLTSISLKLEVIETSPWLTATPKYLGGLAIGSAAAIRPQLFGRQVLYLSLILFAVSAVLYGISYKTSWFFSPLVSITFACLCVDVTILSSVFSKALSLPILKLYGKCSYGIYNYH